MISKGVRTGTTTVIYYTVGMGDLVQSVQVLAEFERYFKTHGDPRLGRVVISSGNYPKIAASVPKGDLNVYWWVGSTSTPSLEWINTYLHNAVVKPDLVLAVSKQMQKHVEGLGRKSMWAPLAVGPTFVPTALPRSGIGYRGTWKHKGPVQEAAMIDPLRSKYGLDEAWAGGPPNVRKTNWPLEDVPVKLAEWHNRKKLVVVTTKDSSEEMGALNLRVAEAAATNTPFIMYRHRAVHEVVGEAVPYQSSSADETLVVVDDVLGNYDEHLAVFARYGEHVRQHHSVEARVRQLIVYIKENM
jgi:hypothetical protein